MKSQEKKIYKRYAWNTDIDIRHRHTDTRKLLWDEIRYTVCNALRQLGFYSQDYLPSNLLSPFRFVTHYTMFRITSCPCRKYDMSNPQCWFHSFFFLVLIPSCIVHPSWYTSICHQKQKIFRKTAEMRYDEIMLGKTLILLTVSESSCT